MLSTLKLLLSRLFNIIGIILCIPFAIVFWGAVQLVDTFLPHG